VRFLSKEAIFIPAAVILSIVLLFADPIAIALAEDTTTPGNTAAVAAAAGTAGGSADTGIVTNVADGASINVSSTAVTSDPAVASGSAVTTGSAVTSGSAITTGSAVTSGSAITTGSAVDIPDNTDSTTNAAISTTGSAIKADDESLWYNPKIPMKKDYQKLLWENCQEKQLDYIDMLALISVESNFYEKCSTGKCKGYFQFKTYI
jgi:hypothetical protein